MSSEEYLAVITDSGGPRREPYARILTGKHAGSIFPMGRNMGKTYPVGTRGLARYIRGAYSGLWRFEPVSVFQGDDDSHLMTVLGVHYLELRHFVGDLMKRTEYIDTDNPLVITLMYRHGQPHLRCVASDDTSWVQLPFAHDQARELAKAAITLLADRVDGHLVYEDNLPEEGGTG